MFGPVSHFSDPLPAAGAYTDQQYTDLPVEIEKVAFYVEYTPAAAGGQPIFRLEWQTVPQVSQLGLPPGPGFRELIIDGSSLVTGDPDATVRSYQAQVIGPLDAAGSTKYVLSCCCPPATRSVRLLIAENGVPGSPGTIDVQIVGQ